MGYYDYFSITPFDTTLNVAGPEQCSADCSRGFRLRIIWGTEDEFPAQRWAMQAVYLAEHETTIWLAETQTGLPLCLTVSWVPNLFIFLGAIRRLSRGKLGLYGA
jgi:hypothetical protein